MTTLHEIMDRLSDVHRLIDEAQGELDEDLEKDLDAVTEDMAEKVNNCLRYADSMAALAVDYKLRASKYTERSKALTGQSERLRGYVLMCMQRAGMEKYTTEDYPEIKIKKNPPKVEVDNNEWIETTGALRWTKTSTKVTTTLDKDKIKRALKAGEKVPHCELVSTKRLDY